MVTIRSWWLYVSMYFIWWTEWAQQCYNWVYYENDSIKFLKWINMKYLTTTELTQISYGFWLWLSVNKTTQFSIEIWNELIIEPKAERWCGIQHIIGNQQWLDGWMRLPYEFHFIYVTFWCLCSLLYHILIIELNDSRCCVAVA